MVIKAFRVLGKASTIIWVAKTGYDAYQAGSTALKAYKKVKGTTSGVSKITKEVKRVWNKKP